MSTPTDDGFDLGDLVQATTSGEVVAPMLGSDLAPLATRGLAHLQALADAADAVEPDETPALVAELIADPARMQDIGVAAHQREAQYEAMLLLLEDGRLRHAAKLSLRRALKRQVPLTRGKIIEQQSTLAVRSLAALAAKAKLQVPRGLQAPKAYDISEAGVIVGDRQILNRPVLILGYLVPADASEVVVHLAWAQPNRKWRQAKVPRSALADMRSLMKVTQMFPLCADGAAVTAYFSEYENVNGPRLPTRACVDTYGWHGEAFVLPHHTLHGDVLYVPADVRKGDGVSSHIASKGSLEAWIDLLLEAPPVTQVAMLAGAATPLVKACGADSFVVDISGESSNGKTVSLHAAATAWGRPTKGGGLVGSWKDTATSLMGRAKLLNSLPVIVDETKHAQRNPEFIAEMVYCLANGGERGRGNVDGRMRADTGTWATISLTTGEQPITTFTKDGGVRARVLCLTDSPFGSSAAAEDYVRRVVEVHGHAGPAVAEWCIARGSDALRAEHAATRDQLRRGVDLGNMGRRLMAHVATLTLAAEALGVRADLHKALELAREAATRVDDPEENVHWQAYRDLHDWCWSHEALFYAEGVNEFGDPVCRSKPATADWLGRVMPDGTIAPIVAVARERLERWGYQPAECFGAWQRSGLLPSYRRVRKRADGSEYETRPRFTRPIKVGGGKATVMPLLRAPSELYSQAA
mgnify:CR=1 FL=1